MLKLKFDVFQKKINDDVMNGHFAEIHCMMDIDKFVFIMRARNKWEYYTIMPFDLIMSYAVNDDENPIDTFDMFVINYCSNTTPVEPAEKERLAEVVSQPEDYNEEIAKKLFQKSVLNAGEDVIEEAENYSDFLSKFFTMIEKKVLTSVNNIEVDKSYMKKTFGEFMKDMFNSVNTVAFANQVKKYIKVDLSTGLESAESELDMQIGFTELYDDKLNQLASQQIDGYMINGKKWPGIKGVTKELQADVIRIVQGGINENKGLQDIKTDIQDKFKIFSNWRAETIARTETTNIINQGKLIGYKESGLPGKKVWDSAIDDRTTDICRRLDGQKRDLDEDFIDPETRKAFSAPAAHPNCRSIVVFEVE